MQRSDFEIMAPAGSRESQQAAISAGADSIYFGIEKLNMRSASASPFTIEDLPEIAAVCKEAGINSYLTLNTVMFDEDLALMRDIVDASIRAGITAVIAADVAVLSYCKEAGMEVHLSTQLNIANIEAVRFYSNWADVAVLARELNMDQVKVISDAILSENICGPKGEPLRIEMFCHGALCMAVSGKCYMSLGTRNRSANRGACLQNCRRSYVLRDDDRDIEFETRDGEKHSYIMSPKDLKTISFIDRMIHAGVRVFKIEGRARSPEYVKTTVACYDEAIREVCEGTFTEESRTKWDARLSTVFNRGFWDGYYLGETVAHLSTSHGSVATEKKVHLGKCVHYFPKASVGEFVMQTGELAVGQKAWVIGPTTGAIEFIVEEIICNGKSVTKAVKGDDITIRVPERVRDTDKLYGIVARDE